MSSVKDQALFYGRKLWGNLSVTRVAMRIKTAISRHRHLMKNASKLRRVIFFNVSIYKAKQLLEAGLTGIDSKSKSIDDIEGRFETLKSKSDNEISEIINDESQEIDMELMGKSGENMTVQMTERSAAIILMAFRHMNKLNQSLMYDLHNVLCIYAWSAFEGYIQAALWDIYARHPDLMSSAKTLTFEEVISRRDDIIELLLSKEIDNVGRLNFRELSSYLGNKLKTTIPSSNFDKMANIYFIRNIISHAAGAVRHDQINLIPENIIVDSGQIRLSNKFIEEVFECLDSTVDQLDNRFVSLYYADRQLRDTSRPTAPLIDQGID